MESPLILFFLHKLEINFLYLCEIASEGASNLIEGDVHHLSLGEEETGIELRGGLMFEKCKLVTQLAFQLFPSGRKKG